MKSDPTIRSYALAALLAISLPPSPARAVSISLVPDGSTTIEIGETLTVDVFMVLDVADQVAGIDAVNFQLEGGGGLVTVTASTAGSVFGQSIVNTKTVFPVLRVPDPRGGFIQADFIAFSQFGPVVNTPEAFLASLTLTGAMGGSYDLVARRVRPGPPLFTSPGSYVNRYDFASDETLRISVPCSGDACEVASLNPIEPEPPTTPSDPDPAEFTLGSGGHVNLLPKTVTTTISYTDMGTFASTLFGTSTSTTQVVPEPHTFALLGLALTGLMLLRRREPSKRSPGS